MLVEAARIDATKQLDGFSLTDVTGTCAQGIYLANTRHAAIRGIGVTGVSGALLNIDNVTGMGLKGAAQFDAAEFIRPRERRAP